MSDALNKSPEGTRVIARHTVPATAPWSSLILAGQTLRVIDTHGQQAVDTLVYNGTDLSERYSGQDTIRCQGSLYIGTGTALVSNLGRTMMTVVDDSCGLHDTCAGACSCESNTVRFGRQTRYLHACRENFLLEGAKHGLTKRDIVPNINLFMNVPIDPDGKCTVVDGVSRPGDHLDLRADMDVLCLISNCPQINNPCNGFNPTPIDIVIYEPRVER